MKTDTKFYTVSEFVQFLRGFLATNVGPVSIQGEVTGFHVSNDRFVWFDIKDEGSVLNCFMLKNELMTVLEDGMEIKILATPQLFAKSGKFHMRIHAVELIGEGALQKAYEQLKQKLNAEGLFAEERKRSIPRFPETIGLITSSDAAAYTDVVRILNNRWSGLRIVHAPVKVQGLGAPNTIVSAFSYFNTQENVDVIILTRGGGSLEDLQAFNSEEVARAVAGSAIPVICGVGHERDVSLAEFVADVRASTPSNAAERAVPDKKEIAYRISRMARSVVGDLDTVVSRLQSDTVSLLARGQSRIEEKMQGGFVRVNASISRIATYIEGRVARGTMRIENHVRALEEVLQGNIRRHNDNLHASIRLLKNINPTNLLKRGYALAWSSKGRLITSVKDVTVGESMRTQLADGDIESTITKR